MFVSTAIAQISIEYIAVIGVSSPFHLPNCVPFLALKLKNFLALFYYIGIITFLFCVSSLGSERSASSLRRDATFISDCIF